MADTKFGYLVVETVDGSVSGLISKLVVPNGSLELSEADSAEMSGGTGDVVGPSSSVNDHIMVFDGTTGKLAKDGGTTIAAIIAGAGGAPLSATYITQTPNATLTNEQALSTLATGLLKNTTTTGVLSIAVAGTDYLTPTGNGSGLTNLNGASLTDNSVSLAKLADIATASFLGRNTGGTGDPEVLSIATAKTMLGLSGTNSGDVTLSGETYLSLAGQALTANQINLASSHVTGILTSNKGGTGSAFFAVAGPTVARTYTFPDASSTIARTDAGQTFTGTNNFQHILPALTDTYDLGSSIKLWRKGWLSELDAVLFAQNTASLIGGWLIIGKNEGAIPVGQDVGSGDTTIDFGQTMTANDFVVFRAALQVEYVQVGTLVSGTRYNVTRNVDGSGANAWVAGTVYLVLGNTGNGRIELNSNSTPRISLITQGSAYNTQTELLRIGDLNGSWGVAAETYGFAVGQYGVAGKSSLRIDDSGIRFFNNITERIRLLADGSGYLANSLIAWDTAGNLTVTGNAVLSGWTATATAWSNGTTYLASGFDIPSPPVTWFGKGAAGYSGMYLQDGSGRAISLLINGNGVYPTLAMQDGTRFRVVVGGLNFAWGSDGATNSMGMKIWNSSGTKLVEFSDVQNIISGWTITSTSLSSGSGSTTVAMDSGGTNPAFYAGSATPGSAPFRVTNAGALTTTNITATGGTIGGWTLASTKLSSTGIDIHSGANAALAFGTTPPTSASSGTGMWFDRLGLVVLTSGIGLLGLSTSGIEIAAGTTKTNRDYRFVDNLSGDYLGGTHCIFNAGSPADVFMVLEANIDNEATGVLINCHGGTSKIELKTSTTAGGARDNILINGGMVMGSASGGAKGLGTLNVSGDIYRNNVAYGNPDFVFEHWATGKIEKFAHKEGAATYNGLRPLSEVREFVRSNYHLPGFGQKAGHGLFSGSDQLLLTVEQMYLYIFELEEQIKELKGKQ